MVERKPIRHGTRFGRDEHRRRGEAPCDPCRLAWNERCRETRRAAVERGWDRRNHEFHCEQCGGLSKSRRRTARFCSSRCYNLFVGNRVDVDTSDAYRAKRKRDRQTRRASLRGASSTGRVVAAEVFAADAYRCHLCNRLTDRRKSVPRPKSPTIDHVIPLTDGGAHEPLNCTACFSCNTRKGNRGGGEQLLLLAI